MMGLGQVGWVMERWGLRASGGWTGICGYTRRPLFSKFKTRCDHLLPQRALSFPYIPFSRRNGIMNIVFSKQCASYSLNTISHRNISHLQSPPTPPRDTQLSQGCGCDSFNTPLSNTPPFIKKKWLPASETLGRPDAPGAHQVVVQFPGSPRRKKTSQHVGSHKSRNLINQDSLEVRDGNTLFFSSILP